VLTELLREAASDAETYVVAGACAPEAQYKLFKKVMREAGFDEKRFVPVDIRGTDNAGIVKRLKERVEALALERSGATA
jgi:heterodisulfide reductase subunit A-like polyferredoxin